MSKLPQTLRTSVKSILSFAEGSWFFLSSWIPLKCRRMHWARVSTVRAERESNPHHAFQPLYHDHHALLSAYSNVVSPKNTQYEGRLTNPAKSHCLQFRSGFLSREMVSSSQWFTLLPNPPCRGELGTAASPAAAPANPFNSEPLWQRGRGAVWLLHPHGKNQGPAGLHSWREEDVIHTLKK